MNIGHENLVDQPGKIPDKPQPYQNQIPGCRHWKQEFSGKRRNDQAGNNSHRQVKQVEPAGKKYPDGEHDPECQQKRNTRFQTRYFPRHIGFRFPGRVKVFRYFRWSQNSILSISPWIFSYWLSVNGYPVIIGLFFQPAPIVITRFIRVIQRVLVRRYYGGFVIPDQIRDPSFLGSGILPQKMFIFFHLTIHD